MHTLAQLKSGKLTGISRLTLSENLTVFPIEILSLADSLEILDLSNNQLKALPEEIGKLTKLKIIFASNNLFEILPESLGQCENLEMIGFKANKIKHPCCRKPTTSRTLARHRLRKRRRSNCATKPTDSLSSSSRKSV